MPQNYPRKNRNLVVGAGISGAIIARKLACVLDEDVLVIDKQKDIGGLCLDYQDENGIFRGKFGVHIFHTNYEYIWKYLNKFSKFIPSFYKCAVSIEDKTVPYPFNLNSIKEIFPESLYKRIEEKLIKRYRLNSSVPIIEFKKYPFLWDKDLDFLANYIYDTVLHLKEKEWTGHIPYVSKRILEKTEINVSKDDRFKKDRFQGVPVFGYKKMIENILNHKNIKVLCDMDFKDVDTMGFDRIFYTGSIDEFFQYKFGVLEYKTADFEFSIQKTPNYDCIQSAPVTLYPKNYDFIRIHEFKRPYKTISDKTVIAKEYLKDFSLKNMQNEGQNQRLYPVLNDKSLKMYKLYKNEARKIKNVYFLGKLGDFKNYSTDGAIKRALEVFDSIKFEAEIKTAADKKECVGVD